MRRFLILGLLVFLTGCGDAKEEKKSSDTGDNEKSAATTNETPSVASVLKEYDDTMNAFRKKYRAAGEKEKAELVKSDLPKTDDYASRVMDLVDKDPTSEEAGKGLLWVSQRTRGEASKRAKALLLEHHLDSEVMADIALAKSRETPSTENQDFLAKLIETSSIERVKGVAAYTMVMQLKNAGPTLEFYEKQVASAKEHAEKNGKSEDPLKLEMLEQAQKRHDDFKAELSPEALAFIETGKNQAGDDLESMLETVSEKYADVLLRERDDKKTLIGQQCESALFKIRNLAIGKVAPNIEGQDLDGESFQLSDYRGKVVVIDFWGDW